jgi:hypothetical protein
VAASSLALQTLYRLTRRTSPAYVSLPTGPGRYIIPAQGFLLVPCSCQWEYKGHQTGLGKGLSLSQSSPFLTRAREFIIRSWPDCLVDPIRDPAAFSWQRKEVEGWISRLGLSLSCSNIAVMFRLGPCQVFGRGQVIQLGAVWAPGFPGERW